MSLESAHYTGEPQPLPSCGTPNGGQMSGFNPLLLNLRLDIAIHAPHALRTKAAALYVPSFIISRFHLLR